MKRRKLTQVRLTEIPLDRRLIAARIAIKHTDDPGERTDILTAALFPSDKVYYVGVDVAESLGVAA